MAANMLKGICQWIRRRASINRPPAEAEVDPLPADAGQRAAEQRLLQYLFHTVAAAQAGFETVERRGRLMPSTPICSSCSVAPCEVWPLKMASSVSWSDSAVARSSSGGSQLVICTGKEISSTT